MLLTITTTDKHASDVSYLLHKHPDKLQSFNLSVGKVHVFYPIYSATKTTVAVLLDIDPIDMVRQTRKLTGKNFALGQYVNDRPYVASSFMSVALAKVFSTAINGRCKDKPALVNVPMPFEVTIDVLPAPRGGAMLIRKLFEPLGYTVQLKRHVLDAQFPQWGDSKYFSVTLTNELTVQDLLKHLYVLVPTLDNDKHYYVSPHEIDKLLAKGQGWLERHPERAQILQRYLKNVKSFARKAAEKLDAASGITPETTNTPKEKRHSPLHQQRLEQVAATLKELGATKVLDLGCGEGKLIRILLKEKQFTQITGMDVSYTALTKCKERLHWDEMSPRQKARIDLFQGALTYKDDRLKGFDAAALVEVIEHLEPNRLQAFEQVVFACAQPKHLILTTPNREYNVLYENLAEGRFRHSDHRFEWSRKEFKTWATRVAQDNNYSVQIAAIGEEDEKVGAPSQMAIFTYEH